MEITRLGPGFAVAPQLRPEQLADVAAQGFRALVNNRPDGEAPDQPPAEAIEAEARRLGLDYLFLPVVPGSLDESQARALAGFLREAPGPVLAFCRSGTRSAHLWNLAQRLG